MKLTDIQKAVEEKYVSLPIEFQTRSGEEKVLNLRNFLRLPEADQDKVDVIISQFDSIKDIGQARGVFIDFLTKLSGNDALAAEFIETIDSDISIMMYIVEEYSKVTQAEKA